ncbi:MAG: hypothetical protein NVSMB6_15760 [Burkholderiaceae bacterium]
MFAQPGKHRRARRSAQLTQGSNKGGEVKYARVDVAQNFFRIDNRRTTYGGAT